MNRAVVVSFLVAVFGQWFVPLWGVRQHERVLARGEIVRIRCQAPDPYDMLRGRYLAVRPEQTQVPAPEGMPTGVRVPVWAMLIEGQGGVSTVQRLSLEPLDGPGVIRLSAWNTGSGTASLEWPFSRLYLNERLGPRADTIAADRIRDGVLPVAELRLLDGQAVLADVSFDGTSIRELARP